MNTRLLVLSAVLVLFTIFSVVVVAGNGYFGFVDLFLAEPWGAQILIDLGICLALFSCWMIPDARARQIPSWPYLVAILGFGSLGALAYLVHRELRSPRRPA